MNRRRQMVDDPGAEHGAFDAADLEFGVVLGMVAGRARTPLGRQQAMALLPTDDVAAVSWRRSCLSETMALHAAGGGLRFQPIEQPDAALERLDLPGAVLDGPELVNLARIAATASDLRTDLKASMDDAPTMFAHVDAVEDLSRLVETSGRALTPAGDIDDRASPALAAVRRQRATTADRLRKMLARHLDASRDEGYLQDDFITQRNNRFVIPVRSDSRRAVEGIVHGTSATGVTLFVEPLETVALNNELVRLAEKEKHEEQQVLADLTRLARDHAGALAQAVEVVGFCDLQAAAAALAAELDARPAEPSAEGELQLEGACHPLLQKSLRAVGKAAVPIDVHLRSGDRVLAISGPNTGGKTVALKTIGLAALMNQAGLPVCARRAVLPVFRQILADIGDHQSIETNTSTFSSHVGALIRMTRRLESPALVLIDELGTGTDPEEGMALGIAVVEFFRERDAQVVVTTHHNGLKAYAETTAGVVNAAVEFDEKALQPTYRLIAGVAGRSGGIDIASRLGLDARISERARSLVSEEGKVTARYVARLADLTAAAADDRRAAADEQRAAEGASRDAAHRRRQEEDDHRRELEVSRVAAEERFEATLQEVLHRLEDSVDRQRLRQEAVRAREAYSRQARHDRPPLAPGLAGPGVEPGEVRPGDRVLLGSTGREATVERVAADGRLTVAVGNIRWVVDSRDIAGPIAAGTAVEPGPDVTVPADTDDSPRELHLIGQRVEEALEALERYLDRALMSGCHEVRIVHGHGSGRLRRAVRERLSKHPAVAAHRPGASAEGGDGATVARLRE